MSLNVLKSEVFQLVIDDDPTWRDVVNGLWNGCLDEDDKRRIKVLATGRGGGGGGTGPTPSWSDQEVTTLAAAVTGDPLTATGLTSTPDGRVDVYGPGGQHLLVGNGVKTKDIYYSGNGGTTARLRTAIVAGDIPYLGDRGVLAGGVPASETITMAYST